MAITRNHCHHCGTELTTVSPLSVDGSFEHKLTNAKHITFTVHCYASAAGTAPGGPATDEHTWFSGHTWRRLFCKQCSRHVGWQFRNRARVFCALIVTSSGG